MIGCIFVFCVLIENFSVVNSVLLLVSVMVGMLFVVVKFVSFLMGIVFFSSECLEWVCRWMNWGVFLVMFLFRCFGWGFVIVGNVKGWDYVLVLF